MAYVDAADGPSVYEDLLQRYQPKALISIERCGRNSQNDYANMRGVSTAGETASIDTLFDMLEQKRNIDINYLRFLNTDYFPYIFPHFFIKIFVV